MDCFGVIMAGGIGQRFWPLSREKIPKQFLNLGGKDIMLNETIGRIELLMKRENIFIVTNQEQMERVRSVSSDKIMEENILVEPAMRNTAACIGYAAFELQERYGECIMFVLPSDHYIEDEKEFVNVLQKAAKVVEEEDVMVAVGITPTYPATGYGYIKFDNDTLEDAKRVIKFVEKPEYEIAKKYLEDGRFVWNSGVYVWRVSTILKEIEQFMLALYESLVHIQEAKKDGRDEEVSRIYKELDSISIDYGVMERSKNMKVVMGNFGWNDIGSWESLNVFHAADYDGNITVGENVSVDTKSCIVYSKDRMVATLGVEDLIVVETEDVVLICDRKRGQDIKGLIEVLKQNNKKEYL